MRKQLFPAWSITNLQLKKTTEHLLSYLYEVSYSLYKKNDGLKSTVFLIKSMRNPDY